MSPQNNNLFTASAQAFSAGDMATAQHLLIEAQKADPDNPEILNALCAVLYRLGDTERALNLIDSITSKNSKNWSYWEQYITILMAIGQHERGAEVCYKASKFIEDSVPLFNYWGLCFQNIGHFEQALEKLTEAQRLAPGNVTVNRNISLNLMKLGRLEESIEVWTRSTTPVDPAVISDKNVNLEVSDDGKLKEQYAELSDTYDTNDLHMEMNDTMHHQMLETFGGSPNTRRKVLDCGCGTGLLGTKIRAFSSVLIGIDQSPEMIERAKNTNTYNSLFLGDMVKKMTQLSDRLDVIVSNSALYHIADLEPFFSAAANLLENGGYLFTSTDPCTDEFEIRQTKLNEYSHSRSYLKRLAKENGLITKSILIMAHRAYPGFWSVFQKT